MITTMHHNFELKPNTRSHRRFVTIGAAVVLLIAIAAVGMTYRVSMIKTQPTVASVARPLDEAGFGSVRTLLIASLEPAVQVSIVPAKSCSPFGSLTACDAPSIIRQTPITIHAPI